MKSVVVLAHGSREQQAVQAWHMLEQAARAKLNADIPVVFQFGMGGLPQALDDLAARGADAITVLPYFLFSGHHLRHTVPELMETWQKTHPHVHLSLAPALGEDERLAGLLADQIANVLQI